MKKLLTLLVVFLFAVACTDKKKNDDKQVETAIQKIDSIETNVEENLQELEKTTNEVQQDLKELDSI